MGLGGDTAYIDREGGRFVAFFYSEGGTYQYGTDSDKVDLKRRLKRAGFKRIVDITESLTPVPTAEEIWIKEFMEGLE